MRFCLSDGYPMQESREMGSTAADASCTNPWHPHHPGKCPHCGDMGFHKPSGLGRNPTDAICANCGEFFAVSVHET